MVFNLTRAACCCSLVMFAASSCKSAGGKSGELKSITDKGFKYERILISVKSKDGVPLEGVKASYRLDAARFQFQNPDTITPGFRPGVYDSFAKGGDLGLTDNAGKIELKNVIYESKYNRPTRLWIVLEETSTLPCDPAHATNQDRWYYKSYGEFVGRDNESVNAWGKCGVTLAHDASDPSQLEIECLSSKNADEIKSYQDETYKSSCLSK